MRKLITLLLVLACATLPAKAGDDWTGKDKAMHAAVSAAFGAAAASVTDNTGAAIAAALVPGVLKEVYDLGHRDRHTPSWKDMGANALGAVLGVGLARWGNLTIGPKWVKWQGVF
jgi:uncharacterized protein YfiM (DUF2279 family)